MRAVEERLAPIRMTMVEIRIQHEAERLAVAGASNAQLDRAEPTAAPRPIGLVAACRSPTCARKKERSRNPGHGGENASG
jgi:hypothetical protein